jgi:tRNA (guanine37-N1)-methyltransferase
LSNLRCDLITIFPEYFSPLELSLIGKARERGLVDISIHNLRDQVAGLHKSVDDTPFGGGPGMVMMAEPWAKAIEQVAVHRADSRPVLVMLTPAGEKFTQKIAEDLSSCDQVIFACGRYEGIDQRVTNYFARDSRYNVKELSIGDYVLNGGEVAAMVILEAVIRLIPGVVGNPLSLVEESHSLPHGSLEYPIYTKPASWRGLDVPEVLLSGNHAQIHSWRMEQARIRSTQIARQTGE